MAGKRKTHTSTAVKKKYNDKTYCRYSVSFRRNKDADLISRVEKLKSDGYKPTDAFRKIMEGEREKYAERLKELRASYRRSLHGADGDPNARYIYTGYVYALEDAGTITHDQAVDLICGLDYTGLRCSELGIHIDVIFGI